MVQQRFALLWGPGAYDVYNAKMQKKVVGGALVPITYGSVPVDPSMKQDRAEKVRV